MTLLVFNSILQGTGIQELGIFSFEPQSVPQYIFNLTLATFGMLIFIGWSVREHLMSFNWDIFYSHNRVYVIWISGMQILIIALVTFVPSTAEAIQGMVGLALTSEPTAFVSLGWGLAIAVSGANKKKLDKKPKEL